MAQNTKPKKKLLVFSSKHFLIIFVQNWDQFLCPFFDYVHIIAHIYIFEVVWSDWCPSTKNYKHCHATTIFDIKRIWNRLENNMFWNTLVYLSIRILNTMRIGLSKFHNIFVWKKYSPSHFISGQFTKPYNVIYSRRPNNVTY